MRFWPFGKKNKRIDITINEGMAIRRLRNGRIVLENLITDETILIIDENRKLVKFGLRDIDFDRVDNLPNAENARRLHVGYGFEIEGFYNGIALVRWTLYPDGLYFRDEDGYGAEDNEETTVYAFIDKSGNVIIPFRDMETSNIRDEYRLKAEECILESEMHSNI